MEIMVLNYYGLKAIYEESTGDLIIFNETDMLVRRCSNVPFDLDIINQKIHDSQDYNTMLKLDVLIGNSDLNLFDKLISKTYMDDGPYFKKASERLKERIEKTIPKKPVKESGYINVCPTCGERIYGDDSKGTAQYCAYCGQRMDFRRKNND